MGVLQDFRSLFRCREDVFARGVPTGKDKFGYPPFRDDKGNDIPLTDEYLQKHFSGEMQIGVYPLFDENMVQWAAMDFDGGDGNEDPLEKAIEQVRAFEKKGILSYVEISRSGNGAHVWVFLDKPIEAKKIRSVLHENLINAETYDRMFPNQDSANGGYGNLIALPYNGNGFRENKSVFINISDGKPVGATDFVKNVKRNKTSFIESLYEKLDHSSKPSQSYSNTGVRSTSKESLTGAIKVVTFCNWMKAARKRMPQQNQEPEFYALCCQFAQLAQGKQLAYEFGRLHPYSDDRIEQKFDQAVRQNKPHTCKTLREVYGYECTCDLDYGVTHCYELANKSFQELQSARKGEMKTWADISKNIIIRTKKLYKEGGNFGFAYGYDRLDDMTSLRDGQLTVIGARTSVGKTSFAIDITANLNNQGIPAYWASMEMSSEELGIKYLGRQAGVDSRRVMEANLDKEDWKKILYYQKANPHMPLYIDDETKDLDSLIDIFAERIYTHGKGVIFIDYIEMIKTYPGESMTQLTSRASLELKAMSRVLDVPVIALSNFNRKAEEDQLEGVEPMDSWLRNSGLLEQTADVIVYLLGKKGKGLLKRIAHIQKERFTGMAGEQCILWFDQARSRFLTAKPNEADGKIIINKEMPQSNLDLL